MKTKIEAGIYEIEIEEKDGVVSVKALSEGDIVEEFELQLEEGAQDFEEKEDGAQDSEEEDLGDKKVKSFGDFAQEEDFDGEELQNGDEDEDKGQDEEEDEEENEDEESPKLESFQSFINKRK